MDFKTVKESTDKKLSPFLSPGSGLILKINDIELTKSKNPPYNPRPVFHMEGEEINNPEFKPFEGARGKIGKVSGNAGYYLSNDNQKAEFLGFLKAIARSIGKTDELEAISAETFEDLVERAKPVLCGHFARYFVSGSEFPKGGDKYGVKLTFPSKRAVESIDADPSSLEPFDWNNTKHYSRIPKQKTDLGSPAQIVPTKDDLPF